MKKIKEINSVVNFVEYIKEYYSSVNPKKHLFFRGHSKISYELIPSIFRKDISEKDVILDFQQYAPEHNINYDFIYDCDKVLGYMQHYGMPTRLIDWSINPLVALYFSCRKPHNTEDEDGRVFIFNPWTYNLKIVKNYRTPEVHQIHILSRALLSYGWTFENIFKYLEKKYIKVELKEEDIEKPFSFVSQYTSKRKINQRGCFTISGIDKGSFDKWDETKESMDYLTVKKDKKEEILNELNLLYINEYSVFPDFEGMSKMIKKWGSLFNWK